MISSPTVELRSYFAPGERNSLEEIRAAHAHLASHDLLQDIIDSMPLMVLLLNGNRQLIAANKRAVDTFGAGEIDSILGLRPGEMARCEHAWDNELGCGTCKTCRYCGAVATILSLIHI